MKRSAGFTLIELVIVIVILGILGAVAAPKLFNLQGDAYGANLNAMKSSISTAATMANAKAQIQGVQNTSTGTDAVVVKGYDGINFTGGYPDATVESGILQTLEGFEKDRYSLSTKEVVTATEAADYEITEGRAALRISPSTIVKTDCQVTYVQAQVRTETDGTEPAAYEPAIVFADITGC